MRDEYRKEFEQRVFPMDQYILSSERGAIDYGMMGIKSLYILNGGAVIILPAYIALFEIPITDQSILILSALFFFGLLATFLANLMAYFNLVYKNVAYQNYRLIEANSIQLEHYSDSYSDEDKERLREDTEAAEKEADTSIDKANNTRIIAIVFAFLGIILFAGGCFFGLATKLHLNHASTHEATQVESTSTAKKPSQPTSK